MNLNLSLSLSFLLKAPLVLSRLGYSLSDSHFLSCVLSLLPLSLCKLCTALMKHPMHVWHRYGFTKFDYEHQTNFQRFFRYGYERCCLFHCMLVARIDCVLAEWV